MDIYETMDFYKKLFPGKEITNIFDKKCLQKVELVFSDGKPNEFHHVQYNKVKTEIIGEKVLYIDIAPHRVTLSTKEIENLINENN